MNYISSFSHKFNLRNYIIEFDDISFWQSTLKPCVKYFGPYRFVIISALHETNIRIKLFFLNILTLQNFENLQDLYFFILYSLMPIMQQEILICK
jgi:hypothetical protein